MTDLAISCEFFMTEKKAVMTVKITDNALLETCSGDLSSAVTKFTMTYDKVADKVYREGAKEYEATGTQMEYISQKRINFLNEAKRVLP